MEPQTEPKLPRNASLNHPGHSFWAYIGIYPHLAPTGYQKVVKMTLKVSEIHLKTDQIQPISTKPPIPATSTNRIELDLISKKTNQTMHTIKL